MLHLVCYTIMSNIGTPTGSIIQVVLHNEGTCIPKQPHELESASLPESETTDPSTEEEGTQQQAQEAETPRPPFCGIQRMSDNSHSHSLFSPMHSSSLGSADMEISCNDESIEAGRNC